MAYIATKEDFDRLESKIDKLIELLATQKPLQKEQYYSLKEVKEIFAVSGKPLDTDTLKRWHVQGKLKQHKPGGEKSKLIYYKKSDVDQLKNNKS